MGNDWHLEPSEGLRSDDVASGIALLEDDLRGGPKQAIAAAIMELLGATDRPPQLDDEKALARTASLRQMAWEYPIEVVQRACREWRKVPQYGRWWPAEQDLRAQCEPEVASTRKLLNKARALKEELERAERARVEREAQVSAFPTDSARAFKQAVRKRWNNDLRWESYCDPRVMVFEGEHGICVRSLIAVHVLETECGDLLKQHKLSVRFAPELFSEKPPWDHRDHSPQDDAFVARGLSKLFHNMQGISASAPRRKA